MVYNKNCSALPHPFLENSEIQLVMKKLEISLIMKNKQSIINLIKTLTNSGLKN